MSRANPLWGAPRIHGELQKLGVVLSQSTVAKYMARRRRPPSHTWRTFLANHVDQVMAANPKLAEDYRGGKEKAFNSLVGQVMRATQGKANPVQVNEILKRKLGG